MKFKFFLLSIFTIIIIFVSCDDTITKPDETIPDKNVSFNRHIQPVILYSCSSLDGCHGSGGSGPTGALLTNWDTITEWVVPGDPEISELALYVDGTKLHFAAIPDILKLNENQIQGIITWIEEGAQNN